MADPTPAAPAEVPAVTPWYLDKGLYVMVLSPIFLALNQRFGLTLDPILLGGAAAIVVAYIVGHKYKSAAISVAQVQAAGAAAGADPKSVANAP